MAEFRLGRRFDAILIPFSGFFCLSPRKKHACLRSVARHLAPGGRFVLDAYGGEFAGPQPEADEPYSDDLVWVANVRVGDESYEVLERNDWWPSRQRLDVTYEYRPENGSRPRRGLLRHWYLTSAQMRALLSEHGFSCRRQRLSRHLPLSEHWAFVASGPGKA
jgi:hypothetical protein